MVDLTIEHLDLEFCQGVFYSFVHKEVLSDYVAYMY